MRIVAAAITKIKISTVLRALLHIGSQKQAFSNYLFTISKKKHLYTFDSLMRSSAFVFKALNLETGKNTIILPRYSCPSFLHGSINAGMKILYVDVNPINLTMDLENIADEELTDIACVVSTNLFGFCSNLSEIDKFCTSRGIRHVVGADYGVESKFQGKYLAEFGHISILNFQEGKVFPIGGSAVLANYEMQSIQHLENYDSLARNCFALVRFCALAILSRPMFYGLLRKALRILKKSAKELSMEDTIRKTRNEIDFRPPSEPIQANFSLTSIQMALGGSLVNIVLNEIEERERISSRIDRILAKNDIFKTVSSVNGLDRIQYVRKPVLVKEYERQNFIQQCEKLGIEASDMYAGHGMRIDSSKFPGAYRLLNELVTLPVNLFMSTKYLKKLERLVEIYEKRR
jgi:dTDP-4-amino-4,6-dideoxygalactose transaminase